MAPPPPLPSRPKPPGEIEPLPPQPGQEEFYRRPDNWPGRGYLVRYVGESIHKSQNTPGAVRNDILIERRVIGRILGKGGRDLEALQLCTGAEVFIIDKYPPPGEGDDHRLLVLIGQPLQVRLCKEKVEAVLERAREELPPLPPPLTSGWRPVPNVGPDNDPEAGPEWVNMAGGGQKRPRDDEGQLRPPPPPGYREHDEYRNVPPPPPNARPDQYANSGYDRGSYDRGGNDRGGGGYGPPERPPPDRFAPPDRYAPAYGRPAYDRAPQQDRESGPVVKKVGTCFDWQRGECMRGEMCKFHHPPL